jgi:hypothetical protein
MKSGDAVFGVNPVARPRRRSTNEILETSGPRKVEMHSDALADIRNFQASAFAWDCPEFS